MTCGSVPALPNHKVCCVKHTECNVIKMLNFGAPWRFEAPPGGGIPYEVITDFSTLINRIAAQRGHWQTLQRLLRRRGRYDLDLEFQLQLG
jgi:hypothetical protein